MIWIFSISKNEIALIIAPLNREKEPLLEATKVEEEMGSKNIFYNFLNLDSISTNFKQPSSNDKGSPASG